MKRIFLPAMFICFCMCVSCEKLSDMIKINVETTADVNFEIPVIGSTDLIDKELATADYVTEIDKAIKAKDPTLSINNIKSVKVISCTLTLNNGSLQNSNNFGSFETLSASISSGTLPYKTVFQAKVPETPSLTFKPEPMTMDLKEIFKSPAPYHCKVSGKARKPTSERLKCTVHMVYFLEVTP